MSHDDQSPPSPSVPDLEGVVVAFLEALIPGRDPVPFSTGLAACYGELIRTWRDPFEYVDVNVDLERLELVGHDGGDAVLEIAASRRIAWPHPLAPDRSSVRRHDGLIRMRWTEGSWRVLDFPVSGAQLQQVFFDACSGEFWARGVRVGVRAALFGEATTVYLRFLNETPGTVVLASAGLTSSHFHRGAVDRFGTGRMPVEPGREVNTGAVFFRAFSPKKRTWLRIVGRDHRGNLLRLGPILLRLGRSWVTQ